MKKTGKIIACLILFFVAFYVLTFIPPLKARVDAAKVITTREKSTQEKIMDAILTFPGDTVSNIFSSFSNLTLKINGGNFQSEENQAEKNYLEFKKNQKNGAKSLTKFAGSESKVKGVSTINGQVLGADASSYVQYLPIPGQANYSSSGFTGSSSINIPLNLPKGFGGYTPAVSLNYSSSAIDSFKAEEDARKMFVFSRQSGPAGLGWSLGESSISIDSHSESNPCFWTWKIGFPGGQGEMFKVDALGNKILKCEYKNTGTRKNPEWEWVTTKAWENSSEWRTIPEMFLKIKSGVARDLFPQDADFQNTTTVWRIQTPDGAAYAFGAGKERGARDGTIMFHHEPWGLFAKGDPKAIDPEQRKDHYITHCSTQITSWKLFESKNIFNQKIKYSYQSAYATGKCKDMMPVTTSRLTQIQYGANSVQFNYNQVRSDIKLVKQEEADLFTNYDAKDQATIDTKALSDIAVLANNNLIRKYKFSYYDAWQSGKNHVSTFNNDCSKGRFKYNTDDGFYTLNDNIKSYNLILKSIEEETISGNSYPKQTFTYQNIPYTVNNLACHPNLTVADDRNSIYLKSASNGFGGMTEYVYDAERLSDRVYESKGKTYMSNAVGASDNKKGSKRARLNKIRVSDGIGNFSESVMKYDNNEPLIVYTPDVVGRANGDKFDSDFLGYSSVTTYAGKKNLSLTNASDPKTWLSKSKTNFYQMLTAKDVKGATVCVRKDPRSGMSYLSQQFDDSGVIAESSSVIAFKNPSGDESCTQIPSRPLVLSLQSQSIKANRGVNLGESTMTAMCSSSSPASYCSYMSVSKNTYDWNFNLSNNPEKGKFAALTKSENYLKKLLSNKTYVTKLMSSGETNYISQGYTDNKIYLLNRPYESWINNVDNLTDSQKYKWQKTFYDGLGRVTKSESLLANDNVVGRSEVVSYDMWGNVLSTRDGNGNLSAVTYDDTFHVYPVSATNSKNQTVKTVYDFQNFGTVSDTNVTKMGLPISVTDINGRVTRSEYDALGRLIKMYKPDDVLPSLEFSYYFQNEIKAGQQVQSEENHNAPIAVLAKVRTVKDTTDDSKILQTYDLYDGLGNKIQSQSLVASRVMTSWQDQDPATLNMIGMKTFSTESFASDKPFGFFNKNYPAGTKISYSETNLSGNYSKSTDIIGNNSFSFSNSEIPASKTVSPNGIYSLSFADPIDRVSTAVFCKDKGSVGDNIFECPTSAKIVSQAFSDFMGAAVKTTDNKGAVISRSSHDSLGRAISSYDHDLGISSVEVYDLNGNVLKTKDAAGTVFEITYDNLNRPVAQKINGVVRSSYSYDAGSNCGDGTSGKLCSKTEFGNNPLDAAKLTTIKKSFKYDSLGRLIENHVNYAGALADWFGSTDFVTQMSYDNIDRMTSVKYPEFSGSQIPAEIVNYTYDGPYLKKAVGDKTYVSDLSYDERGRLIARKLGNGVNENYGYDDAGTRALNSITIAKSNPAATNKIVDLNYTYDNQTGNILKTQDGNLTKAYEYDNLSRLTKTFSGKTSDTFAYDDLNSMTGKFENGKKISYAMNYNSDENVGSYHGVNQITTDSGTGEAKYDVLGRMVSYDIPGDYKMTISSFDLASGKPEKITYINSSVSIVPLSTTATVSATISPIVYATQSAGMTISLKTGINQNLTVPFFETAKDIASAIKTQCNAQIGTYLTMINKGVRKTFVMDYTAQNFDIQATANFDINLISLNDCNLNLFPIKVDESAVKGAIAPVSEVYFYDGEGNRLMKAVLDSTGAISKPVLYASSYLERDFGANLIRKNYFADGKLVATRVFDLNPALTTASISPAPINATCSAGMQKPHFEKNGFGVCASSDACGTNSCQPN